MHQPAKIEFSPYESELAADSRVILTKNIIVEKVYALFGRLSEDYVGELTSRQTFFPSEIFEKNPKIYRGEKYLQLPYVMMDYPRIFSTENVFAIRSFFWWGNFFSITLHLSGKYLLMYSHAVQANLQSLSQNKWYACINKDEWQHHFAADNYILIADNLPGIAKRFEDAASFIKLSKKIPVNNWAEAGKFFTEEFDFLIEMLSAGPLVT